ncbi:MAG: TspO/MBR family protein [Desulfomonilaceae bacterium]
MSKPKQIAGFLASLLIVFGVASLGGFLTNLSVDTWYPSLAKPSWTPSGATIGTVWTILHTLMAIAAWIVWRHSGVGSRRLPLATYAVQLLLNAGWSALFFGLRSPGLALMEICVLWVAILATAASFWKISKPAGALMTPYLAWVSVAGVLNAMIWRLN